MCPLSASPPEEFLCCSNLAQPVCLFIDASHLFHGQSDSHASAPSVSSVSQLPRCHQVHLRARSSTTKQQRNLYFFFLRKEVIQPHLPIRLPCYDFTPVIMPALGSSFLSVRSLTSGITNSHGVTGGVYKTRERIHRSMLIYDY